MARTTTPLTNTEIKAAKAKDKEHTLQDGGGLYLLIKPSGVKIWRFNYYRPDTKTRALISFGAYPSISLADARQLRENAKSLLAKNIDPQNHQRELTEAETAMNSHTFAKVAEAWMQIKKSEISPDYAKDVWRSIEKDLLPTLGNLPVSLIKAKTVISALEPVSGRGALETVRRLSQRVNEIMIYAVNSGLIDANPASGIGRAFKKPAKEHMPTIRPEELPAFMKAVSLASIDLTTRLVIKWQLLTLVRPAEAAETAWEDIDIENKEWRIPAHKMKGNQKRKASGYIHVIPLSEPALDILQTLSPLSQHREHVFPSIKKPKAPMNSQTANAAIKRMGYQDMLVISIILE